MLKRMFYVATSCVLINSISVASVAASTQARTEQELAYKMKAKIAKIGTGPKAQVEVKMKDGTRVKGYISELSENDFVVTDKKTGSPRTVIYTQVKQVKTPVDNPLTDPKAWLGLALIPAVLLALKTKNVR